ncbi:VOC family protein [Aestuariivirga sp.]|uniref:VOC family protein n=1 Tax=Aestuariivirga sp. TaxID=2650926 RepID=UPI0039E51F59
MISPRLTLVTLGVSDLKRARNFYERLGLTASSASQEGVCFFDMNGIVLGLFGHDALAEDAHLSADHPPGFRGMSLAWNTSSEAETDAVMQQAQQAGAKIVNPAEKVFWGGYSGYFTDPDGHL